ncbi:hypothetical protein [Thermomonas sp. HDW16]|uniref:hypothetical protein n=1 Tax=Thermomonas sp. HDW16 TaxID=2714945 RepID=UPI00140CB842|nr:hypothetical protein [Thermomonas sp. HDW16]QIL20919.1 hypothetical protein G7079_09320 [Thermomonas sp. HDW16]
MLRLVLPCLCLSIVGLSVIPSAQAQDAGREMVVPVENVRYDYAQVLEVSPIYQTLRATRTERVCDAKSESGLSRVVSAVKDRLGRTSKEERDAGLSNCRMEPVVREYRRPIAFDVDYVYKGGKFRTRLAQDPGNRLRVRVSITPQPAAGP